MKPSRLFHYLALGIVWFSTTWSASAAAPQDLTCQASYPDPRQVALACTSGDFSGTIRVYNRRQGVDPAKPWRQNISQTDALWIVDARPTAQRKLDGKAALIIDFRPDGTGLKADLYDDQNNDGVVSYTIPNGASEPIVTENDRQLPTIRVQTGEGWWQENNKTNFNLKIAIDGPVRGDFASAVTAYYMKYTTNSTPDFTIEVYDNKKDGIADYELRNSPIKGNYIHSSLSVSNETQAVQLSNSLIWPFLAIKPWGFDQTYNQLQAPIQVDWSKARLLTIGEFVPSRGRSNNWFMYSIDPITKGQNNLTNFESPFAFYNLSGINDGYPDLQVRFERFNPGELVRDFQKPIQSVRYSWDQYHRQSWDYKLDFLGTQEITGSVQFNDFSIQTIPYKDVPRWVVGKTWDQINFVAYEGNGASYGSEGIYEWAAQGDIRESYITGEESGYSLKPFQTISAGYRGEYGVAPKITPRLYFSSVDRKLHLRGAQGGLWNIDKNASIRYADLDNDGYLDQWTAVTGQGSVTSVTRQLNVSRSFLLLNDGQDTVLRQAAAQSSQFETLPPTNQTEWKALGERLGAAGSTYAPGDFRAMMQQFNGPELRITSAQIRDYRPVGPTGFRFLLTLKPGFRVAGANLLALRGLAPGEYAVTYNGTFQITPLTPPALAGSVADAQLVQFQTAAVPVALRNDGLTDEPAATLELWAAPSQGQATLVATDTVTLLAQTTLTPTLQWAAPAAGQWTLTPKLQRADGQVVSFADRQLTVRPARDTSTATMLNMTTTPATLPVLGLTILTFAVVAGLSFRHQWRIHSSTQGDDGS